MEEEVVINMESLSIEEQKAILDRLIDKKSLKITGSNLLREEISKYVNDWENATVEGLNLRRLQCREYFGIMDEILLKYDGPLPPSQIEYLSKEKRLFELLLGRIEDKIKYRESIGRNIGEPIIEKEYLTLIYKRYKDEFKESLESWIERFVYPHGNPVNPIDIDKKAVPGSNRLILIAILATIQTTTMNNFDFKRFVLERFGIKNFEKAKSDHKEKNEFIDVTKACSFILKK